MPPSTRYCSDTGAGVSVVDTPISGMILRTLMSQPFTLFDELWLHSKRHEVTTSDEASILFAEEQGCLVGWCLVRLVGRLVLSHTRGK